MRKKVNGVKQVVIVMADDTRYELPMVRTDTSFSLSPDIVDTSSAADGYRSARALKSGTLVLKGMYKKVTRHSSAKELAKAAKR